MTDPHRRLLKCPHCDAVRGRFLPNVSGDAIVEYYRCDECAHVWTLPKSPGGATITIRPDNSAAGNRRRFGG